MKNNTPKRNKPGPKPLPASRRRGTRVTVFLNPSEYRAAKRQADAAGCWDIPKWARMLMLREIAEREG